MRFLDRFGIWLIMAVGAFARLWNLGYPHKLVFDETYYVKDAWTLSAAGHELAWPENPDPAFVSGQVNSFLSTPSFVVHPPLGKWLIAIGMRVFGAENSFGWRVSAAVFGIAMIYLTYAVARRVLDSDRWGLFVAGLLAIDGEAIVMSRTGLLDIFLAFFALLAFYFLLRDFERHNESVWRRPWLVAMAASLGAATAVKWSGLYFLAAFCLYIVLRYAVKTKNFLKTASKATATFVITVPVTLAVYTASWTGWLISRGGYDRDFSTNPFVALWKYHQDAYQFHIGLSTAHPYSAKAYTWPFMLRPTSFFYESCGDGCSTAITALGNPFIWWASAIALIAIFLGWVTNRDRAAGLVLLGIAGGLVPWLFYPNRTVFSFYAIAFEVWLLMALALALKRLNAKKFAIGFAVAVSLASAFFAPIWFGTEISYVFWQWHMWLPSWI